MKNAIKYFYNLDADSIRQNNDKIFITINKELYYLSLYDNTDVENQYALTNNIPLFNRLIRNNKGSLITNINNKSYVLMKIIIKNRTITINDIYNMNKIYIYQPNSNLLSRCINLWQTKIDYISNQIYENNKKNQTITSSFGYFNGLTETAIELLKNINNNQIYTYISHNRIKYNDTLLDLYNPLIILLDSRIRDTSEYFKSAFFEGVDVENDIKKYLSNLNLNEIQFFFARLLYPSYYIDIYESIVKGKEETKKLQNVLSNINKYEQLLVNIYNYIRNNYTITIIEWLIKT